MEINWIMKLKQVVKFLYIIIIYLKIIKVNNIISVTQVEELDDWY